jgi:hypothetical protein
MRLRLLGAVTVLLAGLAVGESVAAAATPLPVPGGIGVRLLAPPSVASENPLAATYVVAVVAPGTSIRRRVEIGNSTNRTTSVSIYPGAASIRRGAFAFAPGRRRNDLARWTSVSRSSLHLSADRKAIVTVTVRVPPTASSGEHYAVVWAELAAAPRDGVRLVTRVGVRLYVTVGPGGTAPADFAIGRLSAARSAAGAPLVLATVRNGGPRTLLIDGNLTLADGPGRISAGPFPTALAVALSPGGSAQLRVQLDRRLPRGPWSVRLRLHTGRLVRVAVARLTFPPSRPVDATPVSPTGGWRRPLFIALALIGFLVAGRSALELVKRGRRARVAGLPPSSI